MVRNPSAGPLTRGWDRSGEDVADRLAVVNLEALATGDLEAAAVEAEQVQHCRVDVRHVVARLHGVEGQLVGRPGRRANSVLQRGCAERTMSLEGQKAYRPG